MPCNNDNKIECTRTSAGNNGMKTTTCSATDTRFRNTLNKAVASP